MTLEHNMSFKDAQGMRDNDGERAKEPVFRSGSCCV